MDAGAFQMGIGGPGIDPRVWMSLAYVNTGAGVNGADVIVDSREGVFAGVTLMPSQQQDTARLSSEYAANGAGDYVPLIPGEEVLVAVPSGSWDEGLVIVKRLWSPSDPPPAAIVNFSTDASRTLPKGVNQRFVATGAGNWYFDVETGQIVLGGTLGQEASVTNAAMLGTTFVAALQTLVLGLQAFTTALESATDPKVSGAATTLLPIVTDFVAQSELDPNPWLSQKVKQA